MSNFEKMIIVFFFRIIDHSAHTYAEMDIYYTTTTATKMSPANNDSIFYIMTSYIDMGTMFSCHFHWGCIFGLVDDSQL